MSDDRILVRQAGSTERWSSPETSNWLNEAHLRDILTAHPGLVPGVTDQAKAVRELGTSGGWADVCVVDIDGSITVVECKLASSWEKRRTVIGQVIDYASAIWMDGEPSFFRRWTERGGVDLEGELSDVALATLRHNIAGAILHLCLAVDAIDDDLRRLVEYLNHATREDIRVTALQLAYAQHAELEVLIPSTFGGEIAAAKSRPIKPPPEPWTRQTFLDTLGTDADRRLAEQYLERLEATTESLGTHELVRYGSRPNGALDFHPHGLRFAPCQLWANGRGELRLFGLWNYYGNVAHHDGFAGLAALLGQDHGGGAKSVRVDRLDFELVWAQILLCARSINGVEQDGD